VDNLLVKGGVISTLFLPLESPTGNTQRYTQKKVVKVERKVVLNCSFLNSPQLYVLVITNSFINKEQIVREPLVLDININKLG
jgi:hypothetical protein